jgi:hypothetical protein
MIGNQNDQLTEWPTEKKWLASIMTSWQTSLLTKCRVDKVTRHLLKELKIETSEVISGLEVKPETVNFFHFRFQEEANPIVHFVSLFLKTRVLDYTIFYLLGNKHSSLLRKSVNYGRKKFYSTGPKSTSVSTFWWLSQAAFGLTVRM